MVLDRIVAETRADVARRKAETPAEQYTDVPPSDRSLHEALGRRRTGFILECKKASPSLGPIRPNADVVDVAEAYAPFADAISVLTNAPHFRGSLDDLRRVREAAPQPVICKDFIVDPWQVREARAYGADAILLMLSVLDDDTYRACTAEAAALQVDALTEVHTETELGRALRLGAPIIGINNRDLRTLQVDLQTVRRLAPLVPESRIVVCESGIATHADVRALRPLIDAFLVGSALMAEPDLHGAVRRLLFGVNKVCGLTVPEDARVAREMGAVYGGLIFAEESPRRVDRARAREIRDAVDLRWVGVVVNAANAEVADLATDLELAAVQLHGEESAETIAALRPLLPPGCEIWKAVRVRDRIPRLVETGADRLLLDGWAPDRRGGTGQAFDWSLLRDYPDRERVMLGGGLRPDLVEAAAALGTYGLDVNSGVEFAPGRKHPGQLAAFFTARRGEGRHRARRECS